MQQNRSDHARANSLGTSYVGALIVAARHHAIHLSVDQIVHDHGLRVDEVAWRDLVGLAQDCGLKASAARLNWRQVAGLGSVTPAIVLLKSGHAMVLVRVDTEAKLTTVTLQDPLASEGTPLTLDEARFLDACSGDVILLKRHYAFGAEEQPFGLRAIAGRILRNRAIVRDMAISAFMLGLFTLTPILFMNLMLDRVLYYKAVSTFTVLTVAMGVLVLFETAFAWLRRHLAQNLVRRIDVDLWNHIFSELLTLPVSFFERTQTGMIARDISEVFKIRSFLTEQVFGVLLDLVTVVILLPVMFVFNPLLTSLFVGLCAIICGWVILMLPVMHRKTGKVFAAEGRKGSFLIETLHGIRTVKSLALDARRRRDWDKLVAEAAEARYDEASTANLISTVLLPLERLMTNGLLALGVYMAIVENDQIYVGALVAFMMLSMRAAAPLLHASSIIQGYDDAKIAVHTIRNMLDQPREGGRTANSVRPPIRGRVEFRDVRFAYPGSLTPALDQITFTIPEGTVFGIMGRSGSGKTTVTRMLQRLHNDYLGTIKIDDHNLSQFHLDYLRSQIGVVLQDNFLFSGTVAETITATKRDATFDEIIRASRLAGAEEFIERLPNGYDTYIYEGSPNLSGGQRQRLAIARALISDPKLLILDEATSALDAESEAIVNANLMRIAKGRTVIVISHRLSSLVFCDAIMVMERGKVHDIGRHDELLNRCDIYSSLWHQQNRHIEYTRQVSDEHEAA